MSFTLVPPSTWSSKLAFFCATFAAVSTRRLDQLLIPQFYAEDGTMFFVQAETTGWASLALPAGSYLHFVPRILAWLFSGLPWEWLPLAYNLSAALLTAGIALRVVLAEIPPSAAWVGSIAAIAVPSASEQFLNLCCLHFIFGILIVVNLVEPPPGGRALWRRGLELIVAALSGPEVLVLLPLSLAAAWRWRVQRRALACIAGLWLGALVQFAMIREHPRAESVGLIPPFPLLRLYAERLFLNWIDLPPSVAWAATGVIVLALLFVGLPNRNWLMAMLLSASAVGLLIAARSVTSGWPNPFGNGSRYAYTPFVLITWAIGWLLAGAIDKGRRGVALTLLSLIALSSAVRWTGKVQPNYHWRQQVAEAHAGTRKTFRIPGQVMWEFTVPPESRP